MSNSNLISYNFHNSNIRVVKTDKGDYLFCLSDVCNILGLSTPAKTAEQIKKEFERGELNSYPLQTNGGVQEFTMITEPQLYFVMIRSRAKVAREFRQWICNEVLPSIRQTGTYVSNKKSNAKKISWYSRELTKFCADYNLGIDEVEKLVDVANRAFKQGYAIAISKKERELKDKYIFTEDQIENVNQMLHYYEYFKPYLLTVYDKLTKASEHASKVLETIKSLPISKIYDSATASDFNVSSIKRYLELVKK